MAYDKKINKDLVVENHTDNTQKLEEIFNELKKKGIPCVFSGSNILFDNKNIELVTPELEKVQ